jgi:hypothetical protein
MFPVFEKKIAGVRKGRVYSTTKINSGKIFFNYLLDKAFYCSFSALQLCTKIA